MTTSAPPDRASAVPYPLALDAIHRKVAGDQGLVRSRTNHLIASTRALPDAPEGPLARFGISVGSIGAELSSRPPGTDELFATELLDLHESVLHSTLDHALEHLGGRTSDGTTLLARQAVQIQLADIAIRLREDRAMPLERRSADRLARWRTHLRLVAIGRDLLRLLGASGFLLDGPARELHLAEVTGNVYLHPGTEYADA